MSNMHLFFDTETSGKLDFGKSYKFENQPWAVQIGLILSDEETIYSKMVFLIQSYGRAIQPQAYNVHKISAEMCDSNGISESTACFIFLEMLMNSDMIVCHNVDFDKNIIAHMLYNNGFAEEAEYLSKFNSFCTMKNGTDITMIRSRQGYKWPTLSELYNFLFSKELTGAHDALVDINATRECFYEMIKRR